MLNSGSVPADEEATRAQQVRSLRCAVRAVVRRSRSVLLVASLAGTAASYGVALLNGRADQHKQFEVMLNQVRSDVLQQSLIVLQARQLGRLAPGLAAQRRLLDAKCDQAVARLSRDGARRAPALVSSYKNFPQRQPAHPSGSARSADCTG